MNNKVIVSLSALILLLLVIIAAGVYELYRDVPSEEAAPEQESVLCEEMDSVPQAVQEPVQAVHEKKVGTVYPSSRQSFTVTNCGTGKKNTLYQNTDNSIELVDHTGKSLWKRDFPSCICGPVAEVDYFSNKKIQFLIAGGKKLYLVDRLGRDVEGFSMELPFNVEKGPVSISKASGKFWEIKSEGGLVYLNYKANKILTQLPD